MPLHQGAKEIKFLTSENRKMDLISSCNMRVSEISAPQNKSFSYGFRPLSNRNFEFSFWMHPSNLIPMKSSTLHAKKRNSQTEPVLKPTLIEEASMDNEDEEEQLLFGDLEDGDNLEDQYVEDEAELYVGDGGGGGGISLAGTWWDKEALRIAEEVCQSFDGELKIYAFKTLSNSTIQVRIERLTNKSGSPTMEDIEAFSTTYRAWLDEAELAKIIPNDISLEVSSPGVERVVQIPEELDRFKDRPMYVKYVTEIVMSDSSSESDGVFRLISFDIETKCCTWGLADVRINREKAGKGRPLSKKQREWRLSTPFDSLRLVRLFSEI
ncbi:uncharacterized protein LOC110607582 isoform X2 [Manihot esculenta]|uniref:uncharacterized protein LOC110607582 isoform X2 n=1 Tax=Manihot esculenta TaxID=3983 RepID=UPI000B5D129D|nr:uncharacterized protein LOC110607582 isoform X2 [Manihot esculenta]